MLQRTMLQRGLSALLVGATLPLSACATLEEAASEVATSATCLAADRVAEQLADIGKRAGQGASVEELKRQARALQVTADGAATAIGAVAPSAAESLRRAGTGFQAVVDAIPAGSSDIAVQSAVAAAQDSYEQAVASAKTAIGC